jgi:tetratricopeptide (TPR) repeat protein
LKIDPNHVIALNNKGAVLYSLEKYSEAIEWYDKALKIDPKHKQAKFYKRIALKKR